MIGLKNLKRNNMKYEFRPYVKMQPTVVTLTGKVYEKGEHPLYTEHKIIEVVDKEGEIHYAFEDELTSDEVKEQERRYSEEEVIDLFQKYISTQIPLARLRKILNREFNDWFEKFKNK
jgi:hypothetical protein